MGDPLILSMAGNVLFYGIWLYTLNRYYQQKRINRDLSELHQGINAVLRRNNHELVQDNFRLQKREFDRSNKLRAAGRKGAATTNAKRWGTK